MGLSQPLLDQLRDRARKCHNRYRMGFGTDRISLPTEHVIDLVAAAEALQPFAVRCNAAVRPDDADDSGVTVKTKLLRRARAVFKLSELPL